VVLGKVIDALNLNARWGKRYAGSDVALPTSESLALLKRRLELRPVRNTSLIEIRVFGENPVDAAALANAIAETYREYRLEGHGQSTRSAIETLEKRFDEQEQKIHKAQKQVDDLRKSLGISGPDAAGNSPMPTLETETVRQLQGQLIASETQLAKEKIQLEELEKLAANQRRDALQTVVGTDNELGSLFVEHNAAQQRLLAIQNDHTPDHPTSRNATRMADDTAKRINQRIEGIMTGLRTRVNTSQAIVKRLRERLDEARVTDIEKTERSRPYYEAKLRLEELMRFRAVLNLKLTSERLDAELPDAAMVEIIDHASPSLHSVRPNKPRNLFLGAVAGFVLGTLVGVAVASGSSWLRRKAPSQAAAA